MRYSPDPGPPPLGDTDASSPSDDSAEADDAALAWDAAGRQQRCRVSDVCVAVLNGLLMALALAEMAVGWRMMRSRYLERIGSAHANGDLGNGAVRAQYLGHPLAVLIAQAPMYVMLAGLGAAPFALAPYTGRAAPARRRRRAGGLLCCAKRRPWCTLTASRWATGIVCLATTLFCTHRVHTAAGLLALYPSHEGSWKRGYSGTDSPWYTARPAEWLFVEGDYPARAALWDTVLGTRLCGAEVAVPGSRQLASSSSCVAWTIRKLALPPQRSAIENILCFDAGLVECSKTPYMMSKSLRLARAILVSTFLLTALSLGLPLFQRVPCPGRPQLPLWVRGGAGTREEVLVELVVTRSVAR